MRLCSLQYFVLRWLSEDRSYLEIAKIEGIPYATVLEVAEAIARSLKVETVQDAIDVARRGGVI